VLNSRDIELKKELFKEDNELLDLENKRDIRVSNDTNPDANISVCDSEDFDNDQIDKKSKPINKNTKVNKDKTNKNALDHVDKNTLKNEKQKINLLNVLTGKGPKETKKKGKKKWMKKNLWM